MPGLSSLLFMLKCVNPFCAFTVHCDYFKEKPRFEPGICPQCNSPVVVVDAKTRETIKGARIEMDPDKYSYRSVVGIPTQD